jgi:hypothetical protein
MTRLVVPFTELLPETRKALNDSEHPYETVYVGQCDEAYWYLLRNLWRMGEGFMLVEHDIIVVPGLIQELEECPEDWCVAPHTYSVGAIMPHYGLGCAKFSGDLLKRVPDALEQVAEIVDPQHPKRHWCRNDARLTQKVLPVAGEIMHRHATECQHRVGDAKVKPTHGCVK